MSTINQLSDLTCLQEIFLNPDDVIDIAGYTIVIKGRSNELGNRGDGVCTCIKNGIDYHEIDTSYRDEELQFIAVSLNNITIINGCNPLLRPGIVIP